MQMETKLKETSKSSGKNQAIDSARFAPVVLPMISPRRREDKHGMSITCVIPVRAGSRRIKNKNIAPFGDSNLLINKIEQMKQVPEISKIVVSSDSTIMLDMASKHGVYSHQRAEEYCDERTKSFGEVVRHIAESVDGEHVLWGTCTCPLVTPEIYSRAIDEYFSALAGNHDSLVSFEIIKRYMWDDNGPINYKLGLGHVPSQELANVYLPTFGVVIAPRNKMIEWSYFHGINPYKFMLGKRESVDIDDEFDLIYARALLDATGSLKQHDAA